MAIVKFISESDCQLFIDMEYVCDIYANKMHKISLDAGSYLVEAKDIHGNTLNKYELKISQSDTQVLQSISDKKSCIDDSIQKMKNDSSLRFYNQRAVLKYNEQYGYINSQYKIVIPPEYSYAEDFIEERTLVKKVFPDREMATIIDTNGNICFGGWFEYIGGGIDKILLKDNRQFVVVSRCDFSIINKYIDAGYDGESKLIPVYKEVGVDDMYGFIDKEGNEVVPLIYDKVWNYEESGYANVKRFGHIFVVDTYGNLYRNIPSSINKGVMLTREEDLIEEIKNEDKKTLINKGALWLVEEVEKCDKILDIDWFSWSGITYRIGGVCVLAFFDEKKTRLVLDVDSIEPVFLEDGECSDYVIIKKNRKYGVANINGNMIVPLDFDSVTPTIIHEHIIEDSDIYKYYEFVEGNEFCDYFILKRNRKFGVANTNGDIIVPIEFDSVTPTIRHMDSYLDMYDISENNGFIIRKDNKFGIANTLGEVVLPIEYESIIPTKATKEGYTGNYAIVWKNDKCSLVHIPTGELFFQSSYDDIIINELCDEYHHWDSTFLIKEDGKYGFITFNKRILDSIYDEVIFDYEVKSYINSDDRLYYIFTLRKDGKIGVYEYLYDYSDREEYSFYVEPIYDECILLNNRNAVVNQRGMYYVAVRRNDKWGILDIEPAYATYFPSSSCYWRDRPNLVDLEFKYFSIEELKQDADEEFERRFHKYYREHIVGPTGVITW